MVKKIRSKFKKINSTLIELKKRIIFVFFAIIIFRIGSFIQVPGINNFVLLQFFQTQQNTIIDMLNLFSGGALSRASIFSLSVMPYISASILIQLLTLVVKKFIEIKKEGEIGKKKIDQYVRYVTLLISFIQAVSVAITLPHIISMRGLVIHPNFSFYLTTVLSLCTGTMLLMWLGELITIYGIGNGISIILCINIISRIPFIIFHTLQQFQEGVLSLISIFFICIIVFFVTCFVVFIERSYRKIILHYPNPQNIHKVYITKRTHLPLKINMSGVIPAIFASGIIIFFSTMVSLINVHIHIKYLEYLLYYLQPGNFLYIIISSILIFAFCFCYSYISFNPREIANNLKKSGVFIAGIRPGVQTTQYIIHIMNKIVFINGIYIIFICLLPDFLRTLMHVSFYFGGTSLLIVVVVIIDIINQIQTLILSNKYNSILNKSYLNVNNTF
ncbi:preprotein translocase subunit SecY [Buchnera aphidicola]|uniref:preprotein translocase subunit SecY n=1 Tax=Buchnera aphidicola TaxID=9 RepID=UPI003463F57F